MTVVLAERVSADEATALAAYARTLVTSHQVKIVPGGVLKESNGEHEAGTSFLLVNVPTVHAADCAEHDLRSVARIPDAAWAQGWTELERGLQIRIFPDADADDARAYIERYQEREARKRRDLEAHVHELLDLSGAIDTDVISSGTSEDGRGYVSVRVRCVDAADRAEAALLGHGLQLPWKMAGKKALVTRVYPD
jgi:hypothetical protein